jgi:TonB family protein
MRRSFLLSLSLTIPLLALSFSGFCKLRLNDSVEIVFKDTIHVHGKVVDEKGKPLRGISVSSGYYKGLVRTSTKADGNFLLKNVQPNDTLFFEGGNSSAKIYHEGSRIFNVVLREKIYRNFSEATVTAKRQGLKVINISTEKSETSSGFFHDYAVAPEPPGGIIKFYRNLNTKVSYPEKARLANIEGMVKIEFIIDSIGNSTAFKTIQGLGYGCEEAVIEVLKETKWRPGINNGYPFSPTLSVKVLFKLEDL